MWQDFILSIVGIVFTLSLIPQIIDVLHKKCVMNSTTCFITSSGCFVIAFVDFTLNLPYASMISVITGIFWGTMFCYSHPIEKIINGFLHCKLQFYKYYKPNVIQNKPHTNE
jgi:hypothetical protein